MAELNFTINYKSQDIPQSAETASFELVSSALNHSQDFTYFKHVSYFRQYFSWHDYILFSVILIVSAAIGLYYGCYGNKNRSTEEYLMGGKSISVWPLTISLIAGHTSGMIFLGLPADIYMFGSTYAFSFISYIIAGFVVAYVYMPVYYKQKISSTYEYLERRFDKRCRKFASGVFALYVMLYLPVVVYTPALALETVTGANLHWTTFVICGVCIFYTVLGGFKAVVWADTLQFMVTVITLISICILAVQGSGGIGNVWKIAKERGRLDVSFNMDPTERETFWALILGYTVHVIGIFGVNHTCVQKWLAAKSYKESVKTIFGNVIGIGLRNAIIILTSLAMFAKYSGCDPVTTKQVNKRDQLMPYFVIGMSEVAPGLGGLFIAGLFCGELSTLSIYINALVSTVYEDFLKNRLRSRNNPRLTYTVIKLMGVIIGVIAFLEVFLVQNLGGIFSVAITFKTVAYGPLLVLFTLGTLFPRANAKGAFWGSVIALSTAIFMIAGNQYYTYMGMVMQPTKPVSTDSCSFPINVTLPYSSNFTESEKASSQPFFLFRIAFYWYSFITTSIGIAFGLIISHFTGKDVDPPSDKDLLSPLIHSWYLKRNQGFRQCVTEDSGLIELNCQMVPQTDNRLEHSDG